MITIGTTVRWGAKYDKNQPVIGVVTAERPGATGRNRMLEIDGRGWWVSEKLLEGDGMLEKTDIAALKDERDALTAVVAQQCELIMHLQDGATGAKELEDLRDRADDLIALQEAVREYLREATGSLNPSSLDCRKLGTGWENMLAELGKYE